MHFHKATQGMICKNNLCLLYERSLALIQNTKNDTKPSHILIKFAKYSIFGEKKNSMAKAVSFEIPYLKAADVLMGLFFVGCLVCM